MAPLKKTSSNASTTAPLKKTSSNASTTSLSANADPVSAPAPPGGPIEIVFTFDTTGSMHSCLDQVRQKLGDTIGRLFADIPNLKIAVFAHGDYGDTYVTKHVDFTNDINKLCGFVKTVKATGGGDWEECYELVLKQARELLSWTPHTQRAMVMIGDAIPHRLGDARNMNKLDWKEEAGKLRDELGVRVYAVQAYQNAAANDFWEGLAKMTYGKHLNLGQFDTIVDMLMAICYREHGPEFFEAYEREVRAREGAGLRKELDVMFTRLRDGEEPSTLLGKKSASAKPKSTTGKDGTIRKPWKGGVAKKSRTSRKFKKILKEASKKTVKRSTVYDDHIKYSIGKQRRETAGIRTFAFRCLDWTDWQQAIMHSKSVSGKSWIPRRGGQYSVRKFAPKIMKDIDTPAVYEFAFQSGDESRLHPVYLQAETGVVRRGKHWDSRVLRNRRIRLQLAEKFTNDANGCVWIRKVIMDKPVTVNGKIIGSVMEMRKLMHDTYDYSWNSAASRK